MCQHKGAMTTNHDEEQLINDLLDAVQPTQWARTKELARLLGGKGKVVLLRYSEGSASTAKREAGFLDIMSKHPGIEVIQSNRFAGATISAAQDTAMNMLDRLREADGIFTSNESATQGMILALRQTGLIKKKTLVGFDTSSFLLSALKRGDVKALVAQNPTKMGYLGVKTAVAHLRGEPIEEMIDTGCVLVTKENVNTPDIKAVLGGNRDSCDSDAAHPSTQRNQKTLWGDDRSGRS